MAAVIAKGQVYRWRSDGTCYVRVRSRVRGASEPSWTCDVLVLERRASGSEPLRIYGVQRTPRVFRERFLLAQAERVPELEQPGGGAP